MADAARVAEEVEARLAPLSIEANLGWWNSQVEATEENAARRARAELAWSDALADRALFASVEDARRDGASAQVRRRLDLLHNLMLRRQVPDALRARIVELETSVDLRFSRHRGVVGGAEVGDTEIKRVLRRSDDPRERREAWEASKTVGAEVADDVRELARLRNEAARSLGYRDWFALSLATDELDEAKLAETLGECERVTAEPFSRWKAALDGRLAARFGCDIVELRPWHYADPFFQETPPDVAVDLDPYLDGRDVVALARRTIEGLGLDAGGSSLAATSIRATARTSTPSASTWIAPATSGSWRTWSRPTTRRTPCSTSSGTASTTSVWARSSRGRCAPRTWSRRRHRRSSAAPLPGGETGSSASWA